MPMPPLPLPRMKTDERLRKRVLRLIDQGVSHKVIAGKMGMIPSSFSKWLNRKSDRVATTDELDRFDAFVKELQAATASSESDVPAADPPPSKVKDPPPQPHAA